MIVTDTRLNPLLLPLDTQEAKTLVAQLILSRVLTFTGENPDVRNQYRKQLLARLSSKEGRPSGAARVSLEPPTELARLTPGERNGWRHFQSDLPCRATAGVPIFGISIDHAVLAAAQVDDARVVLVWFPSSHDVILLAVARSGKNCCGRVFDTTAGLLNGGLFVARDRLSDLCTYPAMTWQIEPLRPLQFSFKNTAP